MNGNLELEKWFTSKISFDELEHIVSGIPGIVCSVVVPTTSYKNRRVKFEIETKSSDAFSEREIYNYLCLKGFPKSFVYVEEDNMSIAYVYIDKEYVITDEEIRDELYQWTEYDI